MSKGIHRLTDKEVANYSQKGRLPDGGGLNLRVKATGSKSWSFKYAVGKRRIEIGLGAYPAITLSQARDLASRCREALANGRDPSTVINKKGVSSTRATGPARGDTATTFAQATAVFIGLHEADWRNEKHRDQWKMTLGPAYCSAIQNVPVGAVTMEDVLDILEPIWLTKAETATRLRGRLEKVFAFALHKRWSTAPNPALWKKSLEFELPSQKQLKRGHHASMSYVDLPTFWNVLAQRDSISAKALKFTIQTASRTSEVLHARWCEFDLEERLWTLPAPRMKTFRDQVVPLTNAVVRDLEALRAANPLAESDDQQYVFPGARADRPLSNMSMAKVLKCAGYDAYTVHGFRSSFRSWVMEGVPFAGDLAELALSHHVGTAIEQVYRQAKGLALRRQLFDMWQDFLDGADDLDTDAALMTFLKARSDLAQQAQRVAV